MAESPSQTEWKRNVTEEVISEVTDDKTFGPSLESLIKQGWGESPIDYEVVYQALESGEWDIGSDWDHETAGVALRFVQLDLAQRAGRLVDEAYTQSVSGLELIGVTRNRIYIADYGSVWQKRPIGGFVSTEIHRFLQHLHKKQAENDGVIDGDTETDVIVIEKPTVWQVGEMAVMKDLMYAIKAGVTPAEAIDYLMVERRGVNQGQWAKHWRERRQGTISENISKAKKKLRENRPDLLNATDVEIREYQPIL